MSGTAFLELCVLLLCKLLIKYRWTLFNEFLRRNHSNTAAVIVLVGEICCVSLIMDARSASVHVIFCRCFFIIFYSRLSWPNG